MKKSITASLNKIIDIFNVNSNKLDYGEIHKVLEKYITVYADVKPLTGGKYYSEVLIAMQLMSKEYYIFTIRKIDNIKIKMLIKYNENFYDIKKIIDEGNLLKIIALQEDENNAFK